MTARRYWVTGWTVGLIGELELFLVNNYGLRTQLREALHLPLYHIVLTFLTLVSLFFWLNPLKQETRASLRFSPSWACLHVMFYVLIWCALPTIASITSNSPIMSVPMWAAICCLFTSSWLMAVIAFRELFRLLQERAPTLMWLLLASTIAPYLAEFTSNEWTRFANATFQFVEFFLQIIYSDVVSSPVRRVIGTSRFTAEILPGCSGYEGMGLMAVLVISYFAIKGQDQKARPQLWSLAWVLPAAMAAAWLANVFRIVLLVVIGTQISAGIAMRGFHSQAGWLSFTVLGLGLIAWLEHTISAEDRPRQATVRPESCAPQIAFIYLAPLLLTLLCQLISLSLTNEFNYLYGLQVIVVFAFLAHFRKYYRNFVTVPDPSALLVGVLVYAIWIGLSSGSAPAQDPNEHLSPPWSMLWIAIRFAGSVCLAPFAEELAFRGYLMRRTSSIEFEKVNWEQVSLGGVIVSSVCFAALHQDRLAAFVAGTIYGLYVRRTRNLINGIAAHGLTNCCLSIQVLSLSDWSRW